METRGIEPPTSASQTRSRGGPALGEVMNSPPELRSFVDLGWLGSADSRPPADCSRTRHLLNPESLTAADVTRRWWCRRCRCPGPLPPPVLLQPSSPSRPDVGCIGLERVGRWTRVTAELHRASVLLVRRLMDSRSTERSGSQAPTCEDGAVPHGRRLDRTDGHLIVRVDVSVHSSRSSDVRPRFRQPEPTWRVRSMAGPHPSRARQRCAGHPPGARHEHGRHLA